MSSSPSTNEQLGDSPAVQPTKRCGKCKALKPLDDFNKLSKSSDGRQAACRQCQKEANRTYYLLNESKVRRRLGEYAKSNPDVQLKAKKKWRDNNPEAVRKSKDDWLIRNPNKRREYSANRKSALLNRTPPWADRDAISEFYDNSPSGYHVDHVIPLQGELVSGLHVHYNMEYVLPKDNSSKGNKFDPWGFNNDQWIKDWLGR